MLYRSRKVADRSTIEISRPHETVSYQRLGGNSARATRQAHGFSQATLTRDAEIK